MKIPENAKPYRAIVNGVETVYEAGSEQSVPDGVADLISAGRRSLPKKERPAPSFDTLPPVTQEDNGKHLVVRGGEWTAEKINTLAAIDLPEDSTAETLEKLVGDYNKLLAALRHAEIHADVVLITGGSIEHVDSAPAAS